MASTKSANDPVKDKLKFLEEQGRQDLISLFADWKPRQARNRKKGVPLDQRVTIAVTNAERMNLDHEIKQIAKAGSKTTMSQFVRNRALGSVDINEWREIAEKSLKEIETTHKKEDDYKKRILELESFLEDDSIEYEEELEYENEISDLNMKLKNIVSQNQKRTHRLSGRMSMPESETIKWRAQRLCISSSDFFRMMIFNLPPDSTGDAHMSFDAKRRFYISIIDVATNGWGDPPAIYKCSQCENYMEEIRELKERTMQLEKFM